MPFDEGTLSDELGTIAEQDAPPSRIDADRALADGRRTLRRRRAAAAVAGTWVVAVAVTLTLTAGHVFGGSPHVAAPATQVTHTVDWDPLVAPGTFGWLPADARNISYLIAPGPGQGSQVRGEGSEVGDGQVGHDPAMIWLAALDPAKPAPKAGPLDDGSKNILIPAPEVNNRPAFWEVDPVKRDPDTGHAGNLFFQSATGLWANVYGYYLGADPVVDTLLHVARAAHVGDTAVRLPVRISGLPADVTAPVAQLIWPATSNGAQWSLTLSFGVSTEGDLVEVQVLPATAVPVSGTSFGDHCKVSNGLRICVSTMDKRVPKFLPGGFDGLLRDITSLGMDLTHWTTDVIVVP